MPFATFNLQHWPYIEIKFRDKPRDVEDFNDYMSALRHLYTYQQKFHLYFDASDMGNVPIQYIWRQLNFMKANEINTILFMEKCAIVVTSDIVRKTIDFLFQFKQLAAPIRLFKNPVDAWQWTISADPVGARMPDASYVRSKLTAEMNNGSLVAPHIQARLDEMAHNQAAGEGETISAGK